MEEFAFDEKNDNGLRGKEAVVKEECDKKPVLNSPAPYVAGCSSLETPGSSAVENNSEDKGNADLTKKVDVTGDQFTFYTRQDDCFYESCKFRNNTHYHCAQTGCKYSTNSNRLDGHRRFHKNTKRNKKIKPYTRFYTTMDCEFSGCVFKKKVHYHCSTCKISLKYLTDVEDHSCLRNFVTADGDENEHVISDTDNKDSNPSPGDPHLNVRSSKVATSSSNKHHTPGAALEYLSSTTTTNFDSTATEVIHGKRLTVKFICEDKLLEKCAMAFYEGSNARQMRTILHLNDYFTYSGQTNFESIIQHFFSTMKDELKVFYKTPSCIAEDIRQFVGKTECLSQAYKNFPEVSQGFWDIMKTYVMTERQSESLSK